MKIIFLFILSFSTLICSCKNLNSPEEKKLTLCVNENVSKDIKMRNGNNPFDFYELMHDLEKQMLESRVLLKNDRDGYDLALRNILIDTSDNSYPLYQSIVRKSDNVGFDFNLYIVSSSILTKCPYEVFFTKNQTSHKFMYKHILLLNKLEANGYNDINLLNSLINNIDEDSFSKIVYRAPIILLAIINLDLKYNPHLKNYKKGDNNPFKL